MFYRLRLDNAIGVILNNAGLTTTQDKLDFWQTGESVIAGEIGKQLGFSPKECALIAIRNVYSKKQEAGIYTKELNFPADIELFEQEINYSRERDRRGKY